MVAFASDSVGVGVLAGYVLRISATFGRRAQRSRRLEAVRVYVAKTAAFSTRHAMPAAVRVRGERVDAAVSLLNWLCARRDLFLGALMGHSSRGARPG